MGSSALEASLKVLDGLQDDLARVSRRHVKRLIAINRQLIADLEAELAVATKWSRVMKAGLLARARVTAVLLAARAEKQNRPVLDDIAREAGKLSRKALAKQLAIWAREYPGALEMFGPGMPAGALLEPGLIERYNKLSRKWSRRAVSTIRRTLEEGARRRESPEETWKRLADRLMVPTWRAERIVRTELSFASNRRLLEDFRSAAADPDEWRKELIATFDTRTGEDSVSVHKQRRRLDENFEDNQGRSYPHPPNRPNDREVMTFVRVDSPAPRPRKRR